PRLREVVARLRPRLRVLRDERGTELFDLPEAPRPDPDTPVPVRFLPPFDNVLLSHADRTRIMADGYKKQVFTANGIVLGTVLVDGFVRGTWRIDRGKQDATLTVDVRPRLSTVEADAVTGEGAALLAFAAPG